jgi:SAM-dependent methyltransferase
VTGSDPRQIVRSGYDEVADRYLDWIAGWHSGPRARYLARAVELIPQGSSVLEIGCGAGIPVTAALAEDHQVLGVDISPAQIERARLNVPGAEFLVADATTLELPDGSQDAVLAFYSIAHIPRAEHHDLFDRIARWLRPGGLFIASIGASDNPGEVEPGWLGVPMYFSHYDHTASLALVRAAGLRLEESEVLDEVEPEGSVPFLWLIARR